jgi:hypothetical protein
MAKGWNYLSGNWNATCDVCGKKSKASTMVQRWDGFMVCRDDFESRQPQDFVKVPKEKIAVAWTRPQTTDVFVTTSNTADSTINGNEINSTEIN